MVEQFHLHERSAPQEEKRRFPRYPWSVAVEIRDCQERVLRGCLVDMGRGGMMLRTSGTLSLSDPVRIKIDGKSGEGHERIVVLGKTIWCKADRMEGDLYGVAFLRPAMKSYGRLQECREIAHYESIAGNSGLKFVSLVPSMVETQALSHINRDLAFSLICMPIKLRGETLMVATADPSNSRVFKKLELLSQCRIIPVVATPSAIRETQIHFWGRNYRASKEHGPDTLPIRRQRQTRKPRIVTLISVTPDLTATCAGENLAAVLNHYGKRVDLVDLHVDSPAPEDVATFNPSEKSKWRILTLPTDERPSYLDWAIQADEGLVIVSPSHWKRGCQYLEGVFAQFVAIVKHQRASNPKAPIQHRVLSFTVICAQLSDILEGFKVFHQMETMVYSELNMTEPGIDITLHYIGGILKDKKNLQKAGKVGIPIAMLKPHSPSSQCMIHITKALLKPTRARDPRIRLKASVGLRFLGWWKSCKRSVLKLCGT